MNELQILKSLTCCLLWTVKYDSLYKEFPIFVWVCCYCQLHVEIHSWGWKIFFSNWWLTCSMLRLSIVDFRYWAVTYPHYIHTRSSTSIWMLISCVWFMSIIVSLAPLFGWKDDNWAARVNEGACMVSLNIGCREWEYFEIPLTLEQIILVQFWKGFSVSNNHMCSIIFTSHKFIN